MPRPLRRAKHSSYAPGNSLARAATLAAAQPAPEHTRESCDAGAGAGQAANAPPPRPDHTSVPPKTARGLARLAARKPPGSLGRRQSARERVPECLVHRPRAA